MQSKIKDLLNCCYDDTESIEFQLFLITVKCLIPYEDNIGCFFDIDRYKKEIELFAHYMNGNDEVINFWLQHKKPLNTKDELLEFKIIPIVLSNIMWDNLIDEVIKAVAFYSFNKNVILNAIMISSAIYEFMNNTEIEDIDGLTKEKLINFSIKDFLIKHQILIEKNYIIDFEKERIKLIAKTVMFDENTIDQYKVLNYIFRNKAADNDSTTNKDSTTDRSKITDSNSTIDNKVDILDSFSSYLYKLRKGTINPEKLKISDKIPDIKECLKQPLFNHPLLGRCKVVKRTENEVIIRNKSGLMRIRIWKFCW